MSSPGSAQPGSAVPGGRGWLPVWAIVAAGVALVAWVGSIGGPHGPMDALLAVAFALVRSGLLSAAYLVAALGLAAPTRALFRDCAHPWAIQLGVGLALMLTISHALGLAGVIFSGAGVVVAWAPIVLGVGLLLWQVRGRIGSTIEAPGVPWAAWLAVPAVALLVVAASSPPGALWASEAHGYDVLSYHLQLPREWMADGRLRPVEHNVYSFLPGYVEAAYAHLGVLAGGLVRDDARGAIAAQMLHAGLALCMAVLVAALVRSLVSCARDAPVDAAPCPARPAAWLAGGLVLATPWTIVVGSLAYNEMGVTALGAAAMIVASDRSTEPIRRGALSGLIVAVACCAKPTALVLVGPSVGVLLLGLSPRRDWVKIVLAGGVAGTISLAPWLARNWIAAGNPVFPALASVFGTGHWTGEQVARFTGAHQDAGGLVHRLGLLISSQRGVLHRQWAIAFPLALVAAALTSVARQTRRIAGLLVLGMVIELAAWLWLTHLQSRFLLPLIVPMGAIVGLALSRLERVGGWGDGGARGGRVPLLIASIAGAALVVGVPSVWSLWIFSRERGGHPNELLVAGAGVISGEAFAQEYRAGDTRRREAILDSATPEVYLNLTGGAGRVYLLGDSTPLYFTGDVLYHTTWDASPLGQAMRSDPDDPGAWTRSLRGMGVDRVLVNFSELGRLERDGWYDPLVTPERVRAWLEHEARLVRAWPGAGRYLFSIAPP